MYILIALILLPLIEIAVFIQVGGLIGVWPTLALILLTTFAGAALLRSQGFATAQRAREALTRNELPVAEVFDGFCLVAAGVLLLTPGFVTDTFGALLFIPAFRNFLRRRLITHFQRRGQMRVFVDGMEVDPTKPFSNPSRPSQPGVIDGEFREIKSSSGDEPPGPAPGSPSGAQTDEPRDLPPPDSRWRPPHSSR